MIEVGSGRCTRGASRGKYAAKKLEENTRGYTKGAAGPRYSKIDPQLSFQEGPQLPCMTSSVWLAQLVLLLLLLNGTVATTARWPLSRGEPRGAGASPVIFNIIDFGAAGDGSSDCTQAIRAALSHAARHAEEGGATVLVPSPGVFLTGPLLLNNATSHLTLIIERGATLRSLGWHAATAGVWPTVNDLYWNNKSTKPRQDYAPVLWLHGVHDVVVKGGGTIDGNGASGWWQSALRPPATGFDACPLPSCPHCVESCPSRPRLFLCQADTPSVCCRTRISPNPNNLAVLRTRAL